MKLRHPRSCAYIKIRFDRFWPFLLKAVFGSFLANNGHFWLFLAIFAVSGHFFYRFFYRFDSCWPFWLFVTILTGCDHFYHLNCFWLFFNSMTVVNHFWLFLAVSTVFCLLPFWKLLVIFWPFLAIFDYFWPFWTVLTILDRFWPYWPFCSLSNSQWRKSFCEMNKTAEFSNFCKGFWTLHE